MSNKRYVDESGVTSQAYRPGGCGGEEGGDEGVEEDEEQEVEEFEDLLHAFLLLMTEHQDD